MQAKRSSPRGGLFSRVAGAFGGGRGGPPEEADDEGAAWDLSDTLSERGRVSEDLAPARSAPMMEPSIEPEAGPIEDRAPTGPSLSDLVMQQRLDGSFQPRSGESALVATARVLFQLLGAGNTDLRGTWRQAVGKAVAWLLAQLKDGASGTERDVALVVLELWVEAAGSASARERVDAVR